MKRNLIPLKLAFAALCLLALSSFGLGQGTVYRRDGGGPLNAVTLNPQQKKLIDKISAQYGDKLTVLQKQASAGKNVVDQMDDLNRRYSKAMLAVMSKAQKRTYLIAVYKYMQDFCSSHPDTKPQDVFIWGGAYAMSPDSKNLPPGFP